MTASKEAYYIAYESEHLEEVRAQAAQGVAIVCLNFWLERELEKSNIPFISLRDIVDAETGVEQWWALAQNVAREWYRLPAMEFFAYRGIRIAEPMEPIVETYLSRLFYYARIYAALKEKYPNAFVRIPTPVVDDAPTAAGLITFERLAVVDAARLVRLRHTMLGTRPTPPSRHLFPRTLSKSFVVHMYNAIISLLPRRRFKIYASEYWSHIGPIITQMDDTELVLVEVSELTHIPWRTILKHRVRIRHPSDTMHGTIRREAMQLTQKFKESWQSARESVDISLLRKRDGLDWQPVLEAFDYIVAYSPRVIADIAALEQIMKTENPNAVLQLASVGGRRHHFFLMAHIAFQSNIPAVELQHSGGVFDPRSVFSRLETAYLAAYGEIEREQYMRNGYASERIIITGSPRFDQFRASTKHFSSMRVQMLASLGLDSARPVVLVAVPGQQHLGVSSLDFCSYDTAALFAALQQVRRNAPNVQFIFKFRRRHLTSNHRTYLEELFPGGGFATSEEDIHPLICASDCVLSGNSTVMYEAMIAERPLILFPWRGWDYHLSIYAPIAPYPHSTEELIDVLRKLFSDQQYKDSVLAGQRRFMARHALDGRAVERVTALLRNPPRLV